MFYDKICTMGDSRIFSVLRDGRRVATTEIAINNTGRWEGEQTQGKYNAPCSDELVDAANRLAKTYDTVFRKAGSRQAHNHRSVLADSRAETSRARDTNPTPHIPDNRNSYGE